MKGTLIRTAVGGVLAAVALAVGAVAAAPVPFPGARELSLGGPALHAMAVDLTGDGIADVVRTDEDGFGLTVLVNRGDATFTTGTTALSGYRSARPPVPGDVDGDGDADLLVGVYKRDPETYEVLERRVALLTNDGAGGLAVTFLVDECDPWDQVSLVDIDADGDLDAAYATSQIAGTQMVGLLVNDGGGAFAAGPSVPIATGGPDWIDGVVAFGDLGTEGLPLILVRTYAQDTVLIRNFGDLEFSDPIPIRWSQGESVFADVTGDGRRDIVTSRYGRFDVWIGTGDGWIVDDEHYGHGTSFSHGSTPLCVTDLDGDGDNDVVMGTIPGTLSVFRNRGNGIAHDRFDDRFEYDLGGSEPTWVGTGDFDGDGGEELFVHTGESAWIVTPGGETHPVIRSIEPDSADAGATLDFAVRGDGFTPGTTLDFGEGNEVLDLRYESPERLVARVAVKPHGIDNPYEVGTDCDVVAHGTAGTSTREIRALRIAPWWDYHIWSPRGLLKDSAKPGRDRLEFKCRLLDGFLDGLLLEESEDFRLVFGVAGAQCEVSVPGDDPGWKAQTRDGEVVKRTWKSPRGAEPRVKILFRRQGKWKCRVDVKRCDLPGPQSEEIRVEFYLGDYRMATIGDWIETRPGKFKRRAGG